jgi:antitoxin component YwqK of YwqJK toxin-antitoxin module
MNKLNLILVLCLFTNLTFGQDTTFFDAKWKETNKQNSKFYRIQTEEEGKWLRIDHFSENNQIQMKGYFSSINPDIRIGYFEWFHLNGKIKHTGSYSEDKPIGEHLWYFENGKIEAIENYSNGLFDGIYKEYYENGNPSSETKFINGIQNGLTRYFREDGSLESEGNTKDGDRNGEWKYFDENGNLLGTNEFKTEYFFDEAPIYLRLPNSNWYLANKEEGKTTGYIFKRESIIDSLDREIIPAIMVYFEDANDYNQDVVLYSLWKQKPFIQHGVKIGKIYTHENTEYKISIKNLVLYKCSYSEKGFDHIFYMIHMITKNNKGVQIYLDMTKEITSEFEKEFVKTIESLKEI